MTPRKAPASKGLLKRLWEALGDRYHRVLQVIDEALASDNFKEKTWAVDWILKHAPQEDKAENQARHKAERAPSPQELDAMSEEELLTHIRHHLKDWEPD